MRYVLLAVLTALVPAAALDLQAGAQQGLPAPRFSATPVNASATTLDRLVKPNGAIVALVDPRSQEGQRALAFLQQAQPRLKELGMGVVIFAQNVSQASTLQTLAANNGLTVPLALDNNQQVARQFGAAGGATILVVDPKGVVFRRYDANMQQIDIGPLALGGARDLQDALKAGTAEDNAVVTPAPAGDGRAPANRPTDEQTRLRIANGWRLIQGGYLSAALEDARTLAEQRGDDFQATLWLAYCLEASHLYPEAAVTYRRALLARPGNVYALQAVARIDPEGRFRTYADVPGYHAPATQGTTASATANTPAMNQGPSAGPTAPMTTAPEPMRSTTGAGPTAPAAREQQLNTPGATVSQGPGRVGD